MTQRLFVYGPLCHAPLRDVVLGPGHSVRDARLEGYRVAQARDGGIPTLVSAAGSEAGDGEIVTGLLVDGFDDLARRRADLFATMIGCIGETVTVQPEAADRIEALAYLSEVRPSNLAGEWDFAAWARTLGPIWTAAAEEAMATAFGGSGGGPGGRSGQESAAAMAGRWPTMCMRAATRLRAAEGAARDIRADFNAARDVELLHARVPYTEYFSLEDPDLRFRRFDGNWSPSVRRAAFVGGDAATVLPYDPARDSVLMVEQFRAGPLVRGDPHPWSLEPIAGRIDPGESPEDTARREALEEAGLELGTLHKVADYYPTPGAVTEFLFSFVAEADLTGLGGRVGGEVGEDEDIRTHVVPFQRLMELIETGEAGTGPLILSAYWLGLNRARLWG